MKKLLNKSWRGHETWFHADGEKIAIETRKDVSDVLDHNRKLRNEFNGFRHKGAGMNHVAHWDQVHIEMWRNMYGVDVLNPDHWDKVKQLLNDPDWRYLKVVDATL